MPRLHEITDRFNTYFHYTITAYGKDVEPGVPGIVKERPAGSGLTGMLHTKEEKENAFGYAKYMKSVLRGPKQRGDE